MSDQDNSPRGAGNRSISIGRDAIGSQVIAGDRNVITNSGQTISLPAAENVDIRVELEALRAQLMQLETPDRRKIENALSDASDEVSRDEPNRDEVGKALDRALSYAQKAEGFAAILGSIQPHILNAAAWLGQNWHPLVTAAGLPPIT